MLTKMGYSVDKAAFKDKRCPPSKPFTKLRKGGKGRTHGARKSRPNKHATNNSQKPRLVFENELAMHYDPYELETLHDSYYDHPSCDSGTEAATAGACGEDTDMSLSSLDQDDLSVMDELCLAMAISASLEEGEREVSSEESDNVSSVVIDWTCLESDEGICIDLFDDDSRSSRDGNDNVHDGGWSVLSSVASVETFDSQMVKSYKDVLRFSSGSPQQSILPTRKRRPIAPIAVLPGVRGLAIKETDEVNKSHLPFDDHFIREGMKCSRGGRQRRYRKTRKQHKLRR